MTPPVLDVAACEAKLALLSDLVADLERHGDVTEAELTADRDRRHVVERVLTQLVDIAVGLNSTLARGTGHRRPSSYRETFDVVAEAGVISGELAVRLRPSAGMRNLLTHEYGRIELDRVAAAVPRAREDYGDYVAQVRDFLESVAT